MVRRWQRIERYKLNMRTAIDCFLSISRGTLIAVLPFLSPAQLTSITTEENKWLKRILGLPPTTPTAALTALLATQTLQSIAEEQSLCQQLALRTYDTDSTTGRLFSNLALPPLVQDAALSMEIRTAFQSACVSVIVLRALRSKIKIYFREKDHQRKVRLLTQHYQTKRTLGPLQEVIVTNTNWLPLFSLLCSPTSRILILSALTETLPLQANQPWRYEGDVCPVCKSEPEDIYHMLYVCKQWQSNRRHIFLKHPALIPSSTEPHRTTLRRILDPQTQSDMDTIASFLTTMWQMRGERIDQSFFSTQWVVL